MSRILIITLCAQLMLLLAWGRSAWFVDGMCLTLGPKSRVQISCVIGWAEGRLLFLSDNNLHDLEPGLTRVGQPLPGAPILQWGFFRSVEFEYFDFFLAIPFWFLNGFLWIPYAMYRLRQRAKPDRPATEPP